MRELSRTFAKLSFALLNAAHMCPSFGVRKWRPYFPEEPRAFLVHPGSSHLRRALDAAAPALSLRRFGAGAATPTAGAPSPAPRRFVGKPAAAAIGGAGGGGGGGAGAAGTSFLVGLEPLIVLRERK